MSSKRWLICFTLILILILSAVPAFNLYTDPFGVFGDRNYDWYELNMTNNPASAKIAYIDIHHDEYDSYIIGSSGTSSFPVDRLNKYTGCSFFNLFSYGADMEKTYLTSKYILDHYEAKNLVVCIGVPDAVKYMDYGSTVTDILHYKVTGAFSLKYYAKFLFANPKYGKTKIDDLARYKTYLPRFFDIFDTRTGGYDDRVVNLEHIGDLDEYLSREAYSELREENKRSYTVYLPNLDNCVRRLRDLKALCDEKNVEMSLIFMPSFYSYSRQQNWDQVADLMTKIAGVCDFWDFLLSSASFEPRYFQDYVHIRIPLGAMALARVYGDDSIYIPEDFGFYVTAENVAEYTSGFRQRLEELTPEPGRSARFDVLMYHNIREGRASDTEISPERFKEHMDALITAGYSAISISDLVDFVEFGTPLPDNPVLITFDDGYMSNYEYAYPILKEYGLRATVFITTTSVGETIGDLQYFGWAEAQKMAQSGVFEIGRHSFDMHLYPTPASPGPEEGRYGMQRYPGEPEADYIAAIRYDTESFNAAYEQHLGSQPVSLAFPYGAYAQLTEELLREYGYKVTFTTKPGVNEILKGLPQTLYGLNRRTVSGTMTGAELIAMLAG